MDKNPTRDFGINDLVYNVGQLAGQVEGMGREIGLLRESVNKIHCPKEAEINAIGAAGTANTADIIDIRKKIAATENFARGGFSVGRLFVLAIVWIIMTGVPGAVYAYKILRGATTGTTTTTTNTQTQVTP